MENSLIEKSHKDSFFLNMNNKSDLSNHIFSGEPMFKQKPVVVLQVLLMNEGWLMVEIVYKEFYKQND